ERDIRLLRLGGEDGIERDALGLQVLARLLAELLQHLLALAALFQQVKPAVDLGVERDRLAEDDKVDALDQKEHGDEDQAVDDGRRANDHARYSAATGS